MLGENRPLTGNPALKSQIADCNPDAILARTNSTEMSALIDALNAGKTPSLIGGTGELMDMLRGVQDLKSGTPSTVPDFFGFENWRDVVQFADTVEGSHLTTFANLVETRGESQLMWALGRVVSERDGDITISTVHKAKGREWPNVRLMDAFMKSRPEKPENEAAEKRQSQERAAELRLVYVALTRARQTIEVPYPLRQSLGLAGSTAPAQPARRPTISAKVSTPSPLPASWEAPQDWARTKATQPPKHQPPLPNLPRKRGFFAWLLGK